VPEIDTILSAAGINIAGQILDFPRLDRNGSMDTMSHPFIPNQLYAVNISPAFSSGQIGVAGTFSAHVSHPPGSPPPVALTWTAAGRDGNPVSITGADSSASFSPTRSGVYQIGLTIYVDDSLHGHRSFISDRNAYVIVPDEFTETFDHPGLTDKYPWRSSGDTPWTITTSYAETGPSCAQPGAVANGETSTLGIDVMLPSDDTISFSLRSLVSLFSDQLTFSIDSVQEDFFTDAGDWTNWSEPVPAGKHRLTWTYQNFSSTSMNNVWIDNIFFPGNVVVTSAGTSGPTLPTVFALDQNYPNPFNPVTTIRYALPRQSHVVLSIFNALGEKVEDLVNGDVSAGYHDVRLDGNNLASGVYFYRLQAGDFMQTRKLLLLK